MILSFLLGALSGAALAVLFAPRSGRETREILGDDATASRRWSKAGRQTYRDEKDKA